MHARSPLLLALLGAGACSAPPLEAPPFAFLEPGHMGAVVKQPLGNRHDLEGVFDVGPVPDPLNPGSFNTYVVEDDGEVEGRYEVALGLRGVPASHTTLELNVGWRLYDIAGLQPAPDPAIRFVIETVDSMQLQLALRHYVDPSTALGLDLGPRWRMFGEVGISHVPPLTVDSRLEFLTTSKPITSKGKAYRTLSLTGGLAYQWSDGVMIEGGLSWEEPLEDLLVDLSTSVDFGGGQVIDVPIEATMTPVGGLGFLAVSWWW